MKKILMAMMVIAVISAIFISVAAVTDPGYDENLANDKIKEITNNTWATLAIIVRVAAVACVVFAGVRYMFASADQKADIKQGMIYLAIGSILIFAATYIIKFVVGVVNQII